MPDLDGNPTATEKIALEAAQGVAMFVVAEGPCVGAIGSAAELAQQYPGWAMLQEGTRYDPSQYPELARKLQPLYGSRVVPSFSRVEWL